MANVRTWLAVSVYLVIALGIYSTHGRRWPARGLTPFSNMGIISLTPFMKVKKFTFGSNIYCGIRRVKAGCSASEKVSSSASL